MKALFQNIANTINQAARNQRASDLKNLRKELRALESLKGLFARTDNAVSTAAAQDTRYPACMHTQDDVHFCGLLIEMPGHEECDVHTHPAKYAILDKTLAHDVHAIRRGAGLVREDISRRLPEVKSRIKDLKLKK